MFHPNRPRQNPCSFWMLLTCEAIVVQPLTGDPVCHLPESDCSRKQRLQSSRPGATLASSIIISYYSICIHIQYIHIYIYILYCHICFQMFRLSVSIIMGGYDISGRSSGGKIRVLFHQDASRQALLRGVEGGCLLTSQQRGSIRHSAGDRAIRARATFLDLGGLEGCLAILCRGFIRGFMADHIDSSWDLCERHESGA